MRKIEKSVSLMCMDMLHVADQIEVLNQHFDHFHFDLMDGHYCKNLALSPDFLKAIKKVTAKPVDVHIMAMYPEDFIDPLLSAGADCIGFHPSTIERQAYRTLQKLEENGCRKGLVIDAELQLESIPYLNRIDLLTIMTIDTGFAGQKFIPEMLDKIKTAVRLREENSYHYQIQIDGGCKKAYYKDLCDAGADILIVGNAGLFSLDKDAEKACQVMNEEWTDTIGKEYSFLR